MGKFVATHLDLAGVGEASEGFFEMYYGFFALIEVTAVEYA